MALPHKKGNYFFGIALFFLVLSAMLFFSSRQLTGNVVPDLPFTVITVSFILSIFLSLTVFFMTYAHERENKLREEKNILEENKNDFLSIAAHQMRTPLGSSKWKLEMLLHGDYGKLNQKSRDAMNELLKSNQHMITLANNLLEVSSIEEKRSTNKPSRVDLLDILDKVLTEIRPETEQKKISIKTHLPKKEKITLHIDQQRLYAIIENILSNAVKYNKKKGNIDIDITQDKKWTTLEIKDTGIGIPPKEEKHIFAKFFRAPNAIHADTDGSGLGLFVVKSYVDSWGGEVSCKKNTPTGTIFTVKLPTLL